MDPTHSLRCRSISKRFGNRVLFSNLNLEIAPRDRVALLGASGTGKSTLLHCLSGVSPIDEGEIELAGKRIDNLNSEQLAAVRRKSIGTVFQFFHLLPTLTVFENIELPLQLIETSRGARIERVNELIDRMGIADRSSAFPAQLSGGEMQRTAIARAVAHKPKVLFADEPTGNLDRKSGESVLRLLREITEEEGSALLMVTHSDEAATICQSQLLLRDGKLVAK